MLEVIVEEIKGTSRQIQGHLKDLYLVIQTLAIDNISKPSYTVSQKKLSLF